MASEKNFENRIKLYLRSQGVWHVKFFANRMTKVGVPDILACVNGRFVAIEVKGINGKPAPIQLWNIEKIRKSGGIAMVLYPDQFDMFKDLIQELLKGGE